MADISPKKENPSPTKLKEEVVSQTESQVKKYTAVPANISLSQTNAPPYRKKSGDLGLMEDQEDEEDTQNTRVQIDLVKGIRLMAKSKQLAAISGLLGAFTIHLIVGAIYRWNMITEYVSIYYETVWITPIGAPLAMFCAGLTMRLGAKISDLVGSRWVLAGAMMLAGLSTVLASKSESFLTFLLFNNVLFGLSAGLLFLPPLLECHKFFPKMKLITNAIILAGTGLGAVLFGASNIECIQEDNQTILLPEEQLKRIVDNEFSGCFMQMSGLVFLIGLLGVLMMVPMILRNQQKAREEREVSMEERGIGNFCPNEWTSFKSRVFWVVALIIFLSTSGSFYIIMNYKNLLEVKYQDKAFLYWILISGALGNGFSRYIFLYFRVVWGFLYSRIGFKTLFCVCSSMIIISYIAIMATNHHGVYFVAYSINSMALGGMMVIFPNVCLIIFGKKIGQRVYSHYWVVFSLGNFFQFFITLVLTNNPVTADDYSEILFFFGLCVIGGLFACVRETLQGPWKNSLDLVQFKRVKKVKNLPQ